MGHYNAAVIGAFKSSSRPSRSTLSFSCDCTMHSMKISVLGPVHTPPAVAVIEEKNEYRLAESMGGLHYFRLSAQNAVVFVAEKYANKTF